MKELWDQRYSADEYVYGKEPNLFFKTELENLPPGKLLLPGEGEGRNAVYAAKLGWDVWAFDQSTEGKRKAEMLAGQSKVKIDYQIEDYGSAEYPAGSFDCLALVYAHMPPEKRRAFHKKFISWLKPGGKLILEAFSKKQIDKNTGGPKNIGMLFSEEELREDFKSLSNLTITEMDISLDEGSYHLGIASVIRVTGIK